MYDMDEIEIQRKIMDSIESKELREEKARWHRKYNDAEIEISHLKREVDSLISAVKTLIKERDSFIPVRCRECKYFREVTKDRRHTYRWKCDFVDHDRGWTMLPDDFCSRGVKK